MSTRLTANIRVTEDTRDLVRDLKRGQESYNELLRNMAAQYDPSKAKAESAPEVEA